MLTLHLIYDVYHLPHYFFFHSYYFSFKRMFHLLKKNICSKSSIGLLYSKKNWEYYWISAELIIIFVQFLPPQWGIDGTISSGVITAGKWFFSFFMKLLHVQHYPFTSIGNSYRNPLWSATIHDVLWKFPL